MRAISYNILAQRYVRDFPAVTNLEILSWDYRLSLILKAIAVENADLILLQEVELETFEVDFASLFASYSFCRHVVDKNRKNPIGNVILWRNHLVPLGSDDLSVQDGRMVPLGSDDLSVQDRRMVPLGSDDLSVQDRRMVPQNQMLTSCSVIVEFDTFWVANVHLKAQIREGETQRQTQIRSVLKKLNHQKAGFIAGDFNDFLDAGCLYDVKILGLVMTELAPYDLKIHSHLNSAYVFSNEYGHNYWTFDHVLSNKLVVTLKEPSEAELTPFPNESEPSDHLMVVFEFA